MRNLPAVRHHGPVSFFTAVMASDGSSWRARDVDVEDLSDLADLADTLRAVALRENPVIAVIEREDQWFALVRVDGEEDARAFVSDAGASATGHYAELLAPVVELAPDVLGAVDEDDVPPSAAVPELDLSVLEDPPADPPDDPALDPLGVEPDDDPPEPTVPQTWAGDADLLADLGVGADVLVQLVRENPDDPASVLADVGEQLGFADLLEALR